MGNKNSATSKALSGQRTKLASMEEPQPQYVVSMQRKHSTNPEVLSVRAYPTEQQGENEKSLCDDHTFSDYIQRTKYKMRINSNIGCHEDDQRNPAHADHVAHGTNNKETERDPFSDYIQNARKKLRIRTLSRNINSFKRG